MFDKLKSWLLGLWEKLKSLLGLGGEEKKADLPEKGKAKGKKE